MYGYGLGYGAEYRIHEQQDGVRMGANGGPMGAGRAAAQTLEGYHFSGRSNPGIYETMEHPEVDKDLINRQDRTGPNFGNPRTQGADRQRA